MNQNPEFDSLPGYRDWFEVVRAHAACVRVLSERCREVGLTLPQHDVLARLLADGSLRQNDLADRLFVTKSNVTALLSRMERDGLVQRSPDPEDGRAKRVSMTPTGEQRVRASLDRQREVAAGMIAQLTPEECAAMGDMMRRVRAYLEMQ